MHNVCYYGTTEICQDKATSRLFTIFLLAGFALTLFANPSVAAAQVPSDAKQPASSQSTSEPASSPTPAARAPDDSKSESVSTTPSAGKALIYVYRKKQLGGSGQHDKIYVNGAFLVELHDGRNASMEVPQGQVVVISSQYKLSKADMFGPPTSNLAKRAGRIQFDVEAGKTYYIEWYFLPASEVKMRRGYGIAITSMRLVNTMTGINELSATKPATDNDLKDK